jgi:hypothetical protein
VIFSQKQGVDRVQLAATLGGSAGRFHDRLAEFDLWQFGSSISFGFGRHAIVTGDRKERASTHEAATLCDMLILLETIYSTDR